MFLFLNMLARVVKLVKWLIAMVKSLMYIYINASVLTYWRILLREYVVICINDFQFNNLKILKVIKDQNN